MQTYPNYVQEKLVDNEGNITSAWSYQFQQGITYMQNNLSQEGFVVPNLTTSQITDITSIDNKRTDAFGNPAPQYRGALYYDTTTNQFKGNKNGTIVVIA